MEREPELLFDPAQGGRKPLLLAILSLIVGAVAGLLALPSVLPCSEPTIFGIRLRSGLMNSGLRDSSFFWAELRLLPVSPLGWLPAFSPQSAGSGIPHVESQLQQKWSGSPARIPLVKFLGGLLAIGSGLALGREGPTVHIGASAGQLIARFFRCNENECRVLLAAGAGAGLATAFNAPLAGAVFVLEELVGVFDKLHKVCVGWRAVLIGAAVGLLTWFLPGLVGGGDSIT